MYQTVSERIRKILKEDSTYSYGFGCSYTDMDGETHQYVVFDDSFFRTIVSHQYGSRFYSDFDPDTETLAELITSFRNDFTKWFLSRSEMYAGRMFALDQKFNPLENYRGHEERSGSFTHGESVELSFDDRKDVRQDDSYTERTYNDLTEDTTVGARTHEDKISADDAAAPNAYVPSRQGSDTEASDSVVTSGSYKDQKGFTAGDVFEKQGTETTTHSGTDEDGYELDKWGNLGVTTSQQMLQSDLDLLVNNIAMTAVKEFLDMFTYVNEEVD